MSPSGHVLTLNFYSNEIDVLLDTHGDIYVDWDHYQSMLSINVQNEVPLHLHGGSWFIALSYLVAHPMLPDVDSRFDTLVKTEFAPYIAKELGIIQSLLPSITLEYPIYKAGIFEHEGKQYVLESKLRTILGQATPIIPDDVPRKPALISVTSPRHYGLQGLFRQNLFTWLIELNSLPYIIKASMDEYYRPKSEANSVIGALLQTTEGDVIPIKKQYESPGVVGNSQCQLDDPNMTFIGMGLTLKSEL